MEILFEIRNYESAHDLVIQSRDEWEKRNISASIGHNLSARAWYVADLISQIILLPFAALAIVFGIGNAIHKNDIKDPLFLKMIDTFFSVTDRVCLSLLGIFLPVYAHEYRSVRPGKYVAAASLALLAWKGYDLSTRS